jgi:hypothetical protein
MKNLFACLVHENQDCVLDLVRNLRFLDPGSSILLYNGGSDKRLLTRDIPFERYGAILHPAPRPQVWGRLHGFALDCMRFALDNISFDCITIVDSDQLAVRPNYSQFMSAHLERNPGVGVFGTSALVLGAATTVGPAAAAHREIGLWRPLLRRFTNGEVLFVHWTFWPGTVFSREAANQLARFFAEDRQLSEILEKSKVWATEEVVLPTVAALLGFEIAKSPCDYDLVKFRELISPAAVDAAAGKVGIYWAHPVPRNPSDPLRQHIRSKFRDYELTDGAASAAATSDLRLRLTLPVFRQIEKMEGWLDPDEADILMTSATQAVLRHATGDALVEVGSYCGRSTTILAHVAKSIGAGSRVFAIDPHEGMVGAVDSGIKRTQPTLERLKHNLRLAEVADAVEIVRRRSFDVEWTGSISFLLIDGLHDYASVCRDLHHFEPHLCDGALVAFHDYASYYPGVKSFVNELLAGGGYRKVSCAGSMIVLEKMAGSKVIAIGAVAQQTTIEAAPNLQPRPLPLVSCIMPTANRAAFASQAIRYFQRQDYPERELIVMDDGNIPIADLVPREPNIRYFRLAGKNSLGAKHNRCCHEARGEIILHWDDDDWMSPSRISYQVGELLKQSQLTMSGLSRLYFWNPRSSAAWEYVYPNQERPWVAGGTFCYRKALWERKQFLNISEGVDTQYAWSLDHQTVHSLPDNGFYVATVHPGNSGSKHTGDVRWQKTPVDRIRKMVGDDWPFYEALPAHGR